MLAFQHLRSVRKSTSTGSRIPQFMNELMSLLNVVWADGSEEDMAASPENDKPELQRLRSREQVLLAKRHSPNRPRCILRKVSSAPSGSCPPTTEYEDQDKGIATEAHQEEQDTSIDDSILAWFDEADDCAKCIVDGQEFEHSSWRPEAGFAIFCFPNGIDWKSEVAEMRMCKDDVAPEVLKNPLLLVMLQNEHECTLEVPKQGRRPTEMRWQSSARRSSCMMRKKQARQKQRRLSMHG